MKMRMVFLRLWWILYGWVIVRGRTFVPTRFYGRDNDTQPYSWNDTPQRQLVARGKFVNGKIALAEMLRGASHNAVMTLPTPLPQATVWVDSVPRHSYW
jgi:hypothetical protein